MEIPIDNWWSQVLESLQLELFRPIFETWIKTAVMYSCEKITQLQETDRTLIQTLRQLCDAFGVPLRGSKLRGASRRERSYRINMNSRSQK